MSTLPVESSPDAPGFAPLTPPRPPYRESDLVLTGAAAVLPPWARYLDPGPSPFVNTYTRPLPTAAETFSGPGYYTVPPKTSGFAVASIICAIAGVVLAIPAVPAAVLGHIGAHRTRHNILRGHGLAVAGMVLGYAIVGFWTLILGALWAIGEL